MPRNGASDIPATVRRSSAKAQRTWKKTHDSAVETYGEGATAHRTAFASLKHSFRKEGDRWVAKEQPGPSDAQAARGPTTRHRSTDPDRAPTAGGAVEGLDGHTKAELYERARALGIRGRSTMTREALAEAIQAAL